MTGMETQMTPSRESRIQNPVKHFKMQGYAKIVNGF